MSSLLFLLFIQVKLTHDKLEHSLTLTFHHLEGRDYFVDGKLSLADIALVAYTRFAHQAGLDLSKYPHVHLWVHRVEDDLGLEHFT